MIFEKWAKVPEHIPLQCPCGGIDLAIRATVYDVPVLVRVRVVKLIGGINVHYPTIPIVWVVKVGYSVIVIIPIFII